MKKRLFHNAATTLSMIAALMAVECFAAGYPVRFERSDIIFSSNFRTGGREPNGADLINKDNPGSEILSLHEQQYKKIDEVKSLNTGNGSISFWIRPLWEDHDGESHVILSARWNDGRDGYMRYPGAGGNRQAPGNCTSY